MAIATITSITGEAYARDENGNLRELRVGDTLEQGEVLVTSDNGRVELDFGDGSAPTVIEGGEQVAMTPDLDANQPVDAEAASTTDEDLEALLADLESGDGDLLENLEATAAGAGGGGADGGGHGFVRLARIAEDTDPLAFNFQGASLEQAPAVEGENLGPEVAAEVEPDDTSTDVDTDPELPPEVISATVLNMESSMVVEGNNVVFTVTTSVAPTGSPLEITLSNGSVVTIPVGETTGSVILNSREDDVYLQGDDTTTITIVSASGGGFDEIVFGDGADITVVDDDDATTIELFLPQMRPLEQSEQYPQDVQQYSGDILLQPESGIPEGSEVTVGARVQNAPQETDLVITLSNGEQIIIAVGNTEGTVTFELPNVPDGGDTLALTIESVTGGNYEAVDFADALVEFNIRDSVPSTEEASALVDDDGLVGGNQGGAGDDQGQGDNEATFSGSLGLSYGGDGAGTVEFSGMDQQTADLGQEEVIYRWDQASNILTATVNSGARAGTDLFTVTIDNTNTGEYTVELLNNILHSEGDDENNEVANLTYTVTDADGSAASGSLVVNFDDDTPVASDVDAGALTEDGDATQASGNVFTDGDAAYGADGAGSLTWGVAPAELADYGTLTTSSDGSWSYTLDNSLAAVQALDADDALTFELEYTVTDADGDESTATLTVTIEGQTDGPPTIIVEDVDGSLTGADNSVAEASGDTVTGTATVTSEAGIATLTAAGQDITDASTTPVTLTGTYGTLVINGFDAATGVISYAYTEDDTAQDHSGGDDSLIDQFALVVTDLAGETASDSLDIQIIDTAPEAEDDTAAIDEDATTALTGDVLGNDSLGADTPSSVTFASTAASYGTFTANGNGSWSYTLDNSLAAVQALDDGDTLTETFAYTLTDADGDESTATLTVTIEGQTDGPPTLVVEDVDGSLTGADNSVAEASGDTVTGTATVTSEAGIATLTAAGQDITDASTTPVTLTGTYGTLVINGFDAATGVISYAYTEDDTAQDHSGGDDSLIDQFALVVTDLAGETASDSLDIQIIDTAPEAEDDTAAIDEDATTALTGDVLGNDSLGADTPSSVTFASTAASYGTFTANGNGSWSYTLDNSLAAVQALDDGDTLTETFAYTLTDADGDESTATLTVTIEGQTDGPPTIIVEDVDGSLTGADNSVAEASGDTVTGTATVTSEAGIATLTAAGQDITDASTTPVTLTGTYGTLVINGFDAATGVISYAYTEDDTAQDHSGGDDSLIDQFALVVTDLAGETASDSLDIQIIDTAPEAEDDTAAIDEDATTALTGDVLGNDSLGADTPSSVTFASTAASYGTFTANGNGSWSYTLDNSLAAVQALDDGDTLTETFAYTLTDADGDQDTATLTITITGADDNASVATAAATGPDATVYEAGLNPHGSNAASDSETTTGSFTVSASDGIQNVVIGGTTFTLAQVQAFGSTPQTVNTGEGTLTLDSYAGNSVSGTIAYTYTLGATIDNDSKMPSGADAVTLDHFDDSIVIEVNGVGGSTANDDLMIRVIDDTPSLGTFMDGTIPNQIGTVTGLFDLAPGADGIKGFSITGPTLVGITYQPVVTSEINGATTSVLTAISDPDGEGGVDPIIVFSLSVREDGTYTFNLVTPKAAVTETFSLSNLSAGGPGFRELEDDPTTTLNESGRIEFTSNGTGVNANSNNFGVSNSHIDSGEWFEMEFHNPGTLGNDPALTNTEYLDAVTVGVGRQDQGDVTIKWTAYNDGDGKQETGQFVYSGTTGFTIDPLIDFNRIRIENFDDPNNQTDGGRFSASTIGLTKTILPSDQFLDFDIAATDSDGDVTSTSTLSIHVVAQTDASSFTLAGTGADDAIAGSTLTDTINGGDGFNIADYSDSPTGVSIHLDASGNASGAPTDSVDPEVGTIGGGNATGDTLSSIEGLIGSHEHDVLVGNDSNNYLSGGSGNDTLTGGLGADTFVWNFGDQGTSTDPAEDTVTDFTSAQGDVLDISDLLSSMSEGADLSSYIQAEESGSDTTLYISTSGDLGVNGEGADQKIVLKDVSGGGDAGFIQTLIDDGRLDIE